MSDQTEYRNGDTVPILLKKILNKLQDVSGGSGGGGGVSFVDVPATLTSPGSVRDLAIDDTGLYVCYATNHWFKATGVTF